MNRASRAVAMLLALTMPALAQPPKPTESVDPARCQWEWKTGAGIGAWAERCDLTTGLWELKFKGDLPGFVLTIDGEESQTVLQPFAKPADGDIAAILPELRRRGYIPDDGECVFQPVADLGPAVRTLAFFEIAPTGARKAAYDATPEDTIPDPPCGDYGVSPDGMRYFMTDTAHPDRAVFVNIGQDGLMFDEKTVTIE